MDRPPRGKADPAPFATAVDIFGEAFMLTAMQTLNRRQFLGHTLAGTLSAAALSTRAAESGSGQKLRMGLIGCGGYGLTDARAALKSGKVEFIGLCDVDSEHLSDAAQQIGKQQETTPKLFKKYEDLLEMPDLQAVIIATPPHWHALPFLAALSRNLDIYCEKPLAYDVREGRAMVDAAGRSESIVQIGFQRRQSLAIQDVRRLIRDGGIGRVVQVDAQINYTAGLRDTTPQQPPAALDWDLWCGPAPKLPYSPQIGHFAWRLEKEYGHGHLVDWGIHWIDAIRWVLGERAPRAVQASGGIYVFKDKITTPDILTANFEFEKCPVTWRHRIWGAAEYSPDTNNGIFFYGEKGLIFVTDDRWVLVPKGKGSPQIHEITTDMGNRHMAAFLESVRTRKPASCPPEEGYLSTLTVQLGAIAYETTSRVVWDSVAEEVQNNSAAGALLKREYRAPWKHPFMGRG